MCCGEHCERKAQEEAEAAARNAGESKDKKAAAAKEKPKKEEKKVPPQTKTLTAAQYMVQDVVMEQCDSGKESKQGAMVLTEEE